MLENKCLWCGVDTHPPDTKFCTVAHKASWYFSQYVILSLENTGHIERIAALEAECAALRDEIEAYKKQEREDDALARRAADGYEKMKSVPPEEK